MSGLANAPSNGVLSSLPRDDLALIEPYLEDLPLQLRFRLAEADRQIEHVYFLHTGLASVVHGLPREIPIEIGVVGREGLVNLPVILETDRSPNEVFMQIAGAGQRIEADRLRAAMTASASLRSIMLRFANAFMMQVASTVLANGRANLPERLARWLLMADDRHDVPGLPLTHEFLSIMLGVRRSGITLALREFERQGLVARQRGLVTILDRDDLMNLANGYYGVAERELLRLFPTSEHR